MTRRAGSGESEKYSLAEPFKRLPILTFTEEHQHLDPGLESVMQRKDNSIKARWEQLPLTIQILIGFAATVGATLAWAF